MVLKDTRLPLATVLIVLAALSAGCGADLPMEQGPEPGVPNATAPDPNQTAADCDRSIVRSEVESFVEAADSGARPALHAAIADEPAFRQFSHGLDYRTRSRRFWRTKAKASLADHLEGRAARGDRMSLISVDVGSADRSFRICNIGFVIWRKIGDLDRPGERFIGKGAVSMDGGIAVWNTGAPQRFAR